MKSLKSKQSLMTYFQRGYKYYYSTLSQDEMNCYNSILCGLIACQTKIIIPKFYCNHIFQIYLLILLDNPYLFYVDNLSVSSEYYADDKTELTVSYLYDTPQVINMINNVEARHSGLLASINSYSPMKKVVAIHDYFIDNIKYDKASNPLSFTAMGPLLYDLGVCSGVSYAAKVMLDICGIDSVVVQGELFDPITKANESHAWNLIRTNNFFTHYDITSDLGLSVNIKRYDYTGLSSEEIEKDHLITLGQIDCPTSNNYYLQNGLALRKKSDFEQFIYNALSSGESSACFKILSDAEPEKIQSQIENIIQSQLSATNSSFNKFYIEVNETQKVFHIKFAR